MKQVKNSEAEHHNYFDGAVSVTEFNFSDEQSMNDAEITIHGRYPLAGYAVNDVSLVLVSIESGIGTITMRGSDARELEVGDRLLIKPGEPYSFSTLGRLAIRYIATPAWTPEQARIVEE